MGVGGGEGEVVGLWEERGSDLRGGVISTICMELIYDMGTLLIFALILCPLF